MINLAFEKRTLMARLYLLTMILVLILVGCDRAPARKSNSMQPVSELSGTDSVIVKQLMERSSAYFKEGGISATVFDDFMKEAEDIAKKSGSKSQLALIYNQVGKRYRNRALYGEAMKYHQMALDLATQAQNDQILTSVYNQIGVVYRRIDDNPMALEMHMKALKLAEALNDTFSISSAINSIGNVNYNMGRYHTSIEYFQKSLELSAGMNNKLGLAINYNNMGESLLSLGEVDSALTCFYTSLKYNRQINSRIGESICFNSIGAAYIALGKPHQALGYLDEALKINQELGDVMQEAISYTKIGATYLNMNELTRAMTHLQKGYDLSLRIGSKFQVEEASRLLGALFEKRGDYERGLEFFKTAAAFRDSMINEKNMHHLATMEAIFDSDRQRNRIEELNQQTLQQRSLLERQKWMLIAVFALILVLSLVVLLVARQFRLQGRFRNLKHQQRLLRSQMNPHFIFNALSAIQVFVLENDIEKSTRFLSDFAKLMRQVLRSSNQDYISLEEEKNILNYYLELQRLRFMSPFEFFIHVDETLKPDRIMIPPMITQPFVENAIEHGIRPLGGEGRVDITFRHAENLMIIEVEDNGIGIDKSKKMKEAGRGHESMALDITRERLEVIRRDSGGKVGLEIIDKKQVNPFDKGTLVRIIFPIVEVYPKGLAANGHKKSKNLMDKVTG